MPTMQSVRVRVPATTANFGPGFDALGAALRLYNIVTVTRGRGAAPGAMATEAGRLFFKESGVRPFAFRWEVVGDVPRSRGLGSSVTVRLGILCGLNELAGAPLRRDRLFRLCDELEGHPDNAAPAAYGGFCIAPAEGPLQRYRIGSELAFVLLVPGLELVTDEAREILPRSIPFARAVVSAGNAAGVAGAFASGDYRKLAGCFGDGIHQLARSRLMPWLDAVIAAGEAAGALGGWLSGSGTTIACAALRRPERIADAMVAACGLDSACAMVVRADNTGYKVLR
jgi:homoserine kinase